MYLAIPTEPIGSIPLPAKLDASGVSLRSFIDPLNIAPASEPDRKRVLEFISRNIRPGQRVFIDVTTLIDLYIETQEEVRDHALEAVVCIPRDQLGTTDDCGFAPFCDDMSTSREIAFAKIRVRVEGTRLATALLNG